MKGVGRELEERENLRNISPSRYLQTGGREKANIIYKIAQRGLCYTVRAKLFRTDYNDNRRPGHRDLT